MQVATPQSSFAEQLPHLWEHLSHILPSQASIRDFVHHNTLHGFQHLPFPEALKAARAITGAYGYLSAAKFREYVKQGRITLDDLNTVLTQDPHLQSAQVIAELPDKTITALDIYRTALLYPLEATTQRQLIWQMEAQHALRQWQADLPALQHQALATQAQQQGYVSTAAALEDLWTACTEVLHLSRAPLHPEALLERTPSLNAHPDPHLRRHAQHQLQSLIRAVGEHKTLRQLLIELMGVDILAEMRPLIVRYVGNWLDQGVASWTPEHAEQGFYKTWKELARLDLGWLLEDLPDWEEHIADLPDNAVATLEVELRRLDIPPEHWLAYLEHLANELPGWSGMVLWRQQRPHYDDLPRTISMEDFLAVRLVLEHVFARRLCRRHWRIDANLSALRTLTQRHPLELWVEYHGYQSDIPEYLQILTQQHLSRQREHHSETLWQALAHHLWHWQQQNHQQMAAQHGHQINDHGWRLFRLAQHLGLSAGQVRALTPENLKSIFACLARLDDETCGYTWLRAYERHYREQVFNALHHNHQPPTPQSLPNAQVIFCMDDREEGFRRHLEELHPEIETLGAAAFFNIPMNYQGLDDAKAFKLCPVPVTPQHVIEEIPASNVSQPAQQQHHTRIKLHRVWQDKLHQITRSQLVTGTLASLMAAPAALGVMLGKSFEPRMYGNWVKGLGEKFDSPIATRLHTTSTQLDSERSATHNQHGFTLEEQAQLVGDFLQANGLIQHFAPIVVMMGHYSSNQNNPHQAAYGCGACSGRYSGPNGRAFAAMANNPEVRHVLAERGITIPASCWFLGAEHDTCNEQIRWFDLDLLPAPLQASFKTLDQALYTASQYSAHERCRKLMSAPRNPTPLQALHHMQGRSMDYSQPRPELGHVTNAVALVGRRNMSQGIFLDRRSFLISYDYRTDPDGSLLERTLLSVGPVGAGISLEYYFSMVSNHRYGAGSKVTHNLTGLLGVMEGACSDLRTGLPKQMIEIHEAMRLLIILECHPDTASAIYQRQPMLQELIGNAWVQVAVKNPESGEIFQFNPVTGFAKWAPTEQGISTVKRSTDWYHGQHDHLPPALVKAEVTHA